MLKIYLMSTIISIVVSLVSINAILDRLKIEGYISKDKKGSTAEAMRLMLFFFIPIFNVLLASAFLFGTESIINRVKENYAIKKES